MVNLVAVVYAWSIIIIVVVFVVMMIVVEVMMVAIVTIAFDWFPSLTYLSPYPHPSSLPPRLSFVIVFSFRWYWITILVTSHCTKKWYNCMTNKWMWCTLQLFYQLPNVYCSDHSFNFKPFQKVGKIFVLIISNKYTL